MRIEDIKKVILLSVEQIIVPHLIKSKKFNNWVEEKIKEKVNGSQKNINTIK